MVSYLAYIIIFFFSAYVLYGFFLLVQGFIIKIKNSVSMAVSGKLTIRNDDLEKYLLKKFTYYDKLPDNLKLKFLLRVKNFISGKSFEGREDFEVTNEMKALVAASAVQLTFGLNKYSLDHFTKIILYPEAFYNRQTDAMHMGETNLRGVIVLSWKDLKEGYENATDNFNVGLHEMAHALELQFLLKEDYDTFFGNYYPKWLLIANEEFQNLEDDRSSFFRKYAGVNKHEFFAVCIEYFFESGDEFRKHLPEIYYHLCILLNQDPLQKDGHVEEVKRKSLEEMESEINTMLPVFVPKYSITNLSFHSLYFLLILYIMILQAYNGKMSLVYFLSLMSVIAIASIYYMMNKIILYEKYLAVKDLFGKTKNIYELDEIVAVNVNNTRSGDSLEIILARNGKILRNRYPYLAKSGDISFLLEKLKEKKIAVR